MISIKKVGKKALLLSALVATTLTSCEEEDKATTPVGENPFVLSLAYQGSDGTFTYYTLPVNDVMSGTIKEEGEGIEQPGYYDFTQIENNIYSIGGLDDVDLVNIRQDAEGNLTEYGDISFDNSLADLIKADANTLVGVEMRSSSDQIVFHTIDMGTVKVSKTVNHNVSEITNLEGPSYAGMRVSGDYLYLSYYISDPTTYQTPTVDTAYVAVFNYPELTLETVIKETKIGSIGGFNIKCGLITDEKGDVYALSHMNPANGYSQSTDATGIMKIKSGQTSFDQDYYFDVQEKSGGKNASHLVYLGNGKVFAEMNAEDVSVQSSWADGPLETAIIDIYTQEVTFVTGVPQHAGTGRRLPAVHTDGMVYLPVTHDDGDIYVYQIDPSNATAKKGAKVDANFVAGLFRL